MRSSIGSFFENKEVSMSISYEYYKIFYYVARYQSFNQAAKVLLNSQPNIARAINNLESELGCKLFDRSHRGVRLTNQGQLLYEHVSEAHKHIRLAEDNLRTMVNGRKWTISLGISIGITDVVIRNRILPPLKDFTRSNKDVNIRILNDSTPNLIKGVIDGSVNLAIITTTSFSEPILREHILYTFFEIPIAGNAFRDELYGRTVSLKDLTSYPVITLQRDSESFSIHDRLFASHGAILHPNIEASTMRQALAFVENDMGIACIAEEYVRPAIERGSIFRINVDVGIPTREISLYINKVGMSPEAVDLENHILEYNKQLSNKT